MACEQNDLYSSFADVPLRQEDSNDVADDPCSSAMAKMNAQNCRAAGRIGGKNKCAWAMMDNGMSNTCCDRQYLLVPQFQKFTPHGQCTVHWRSA